MGGVLLPFVMRKLLLDVYLESVDALEPLLNQFMKDTMEDLAQFE